MALGLPKSIHPEVREMDDLRQRLEGQFNSYLNSFSAQSKLLNKPPAKEDIDRMNQLARTPPQRMTLVSASIYDRNRNWVNFVLGRYLEQVKIFQETGYRHRLYTPEMLGKQPLTTTAHGAQLTAAQEAQRRINRKLHGVKEEGELPEGLAMGGHSPLGTTAPQQAPKREGAPAPGPVATPSPAAAGPSGGEAPRIQRKVIIRRIIKKKADGTQEVVEERTVVEIPIAAGGQLGAIATPTAAPRPQSPLGAPAGVQKPVGPAPPGSNPAIRPVVPGGPPGAARPAAPGSAAPATAPRPTSAPVQAPRPAKPVDKEIDDFFKKYNLK